MRSGHEPSEMLILAPDWTKKERKENVLQIDRLIAWIILAYLFAKSVDNFTFFTNNTTNFL